MRAGTGVGLLTGALWLVNHALEVFTRLGDRPGLLATAPFFLGGFALWGVAGFLGARRTGAVRLGVLAAVWAAMVCVLVLTTFGFVLLHTSLPRLEQDLAGGPDFPRSGWTDLRAFAVANTFDAGFSHLLAAPILAAVFGGVGALTGKLLPRRRRRVGAPTAGGA